MVPVLHKGPVGFFRNLNPLRFAGGHGVVPAEIVQIDIQDQPRPWKSVVWVHPAVFDFTGQFFPVIFFPAGSKPGRACMPVPVLLRLLQVRHLDTAPASLHQRHADPGCPDPGRDQLLEDMYSLKGPLPHGGSDKIRDAQTAVGKCQRLALVLRHGGQVPIIARAFHVVVVINVEQIVSGRRDHPHIDHSVPVIIGVPVLLHEHGRYSQHLPPLPRGLQDLHFCQFNGTAEVYRIYPTSLPFLSTVILESQ